MASNDVRILAKVDIAGTPYRIRRFELEEQLDELPTLHLDLLAWEGPPPAPRDVIDQPVVFTVARSDGAGERRFTGSVVEASRAHDRGGDSVLRVVASSALFALGKRADCRLFLDKSPVDVVKAVLEGAGRGAQHQAWKTTGSYEPRPQIVQYRETDLAFLRRLLAEEGIWFVVTSEGEEDDLITLGDAPDGTGKTSPEVVPFNASFGFEAFTDHILAIERREAVRSDATFLRDYDPEKPAVKVDGTAEGTDPGPHALEVYAWPARAKTPAAAKQRAKVLLEQLQVDRVRVSGRTGSLALVPGRVFTLEQHPWDPMNEDYLVTGSRLRGTPPDAAADEMVSGGLVADITFEGAPTKRVKHRPPRREPAAVSIGAQTAFVTGASGEEIHTDAAGRVKARFHWDRSGITDDKSSRWLRTSQVPLGGSMFLPRMGWEVSMRHTGGDPDEPFVFGRMVNGTATTSYSLPGEKGRSAIQTATTPGGGSSNELRFGDDAGSELMFVNASKDMAVDVKNNATEGIGNNLDRKIGSNQSQSVTDSSSFKVGANQSITVSGNQTIHSETFAVDDIGGNHALTIGGNRDMKIGGDHKRDVTGDSTSTVGANRIDLVVGSVTHDALGAYAHDVGAALIELSIGARTVTVGGARSEKTGALKIVAANGGRGVEVGGSMNLDVVGALINVASGDRTEKSGGNYTEVAAGAHVVKCTNMTLEGESMVTIVMGASVLCVTPAMVALLGVSAKLDGDLSDLGIVIDN